MGILRQLIDAVEFMHSLGVCHFDISLENILINDVQVTLRRDSYGKEMISFQKKDIQIKLCDFGLAEALKRNTNPMSSNFVGKSIYMSPEISAKREFNPMQNDVWCLGVCAFILLIGAHPWQTTLMSDVNFATIMNGDILKLLKSWHRLDFVTNDILR